MIPKSPEYPVCKTYHDFLVDTMEALKLPYIFVHAYVQVYARTLHIIWKHRDLYSKIIPIMSGLHQLRVFQRVIFKRYNCLGLHCLGLQDWIVVPGTFFVVSVSQAFEGSRYYCSMRLYKEGFDALCGKIH